jgi:predicted DNA-binding antitoxin AbrB/MazE fold protein
MTYRGHVRNGVVQLDEPVSLPEGAEVRVDVLASPEDARVESSVPSLYEQLKNVIGKATELPPDLAENHDHYLHGLSKK